MHDSSSTTPEPILATPVLPVAAPATIAPPMPDDAPRRLDPALLRVWGMASVITAIVFLVITFAIAMIALFSQTLIAALGGLAFFVIFLISCWTGISYNPRYYDSWRYTLRERDLDITFGVWWHTRRCIPRSRVQHVDIQQGPIARSFGIVDVSLFTAGTTAAVVTIPGISPAEAERLRTELLSAEATDDDAPTSTSPSHDAH